MSTLDRDSRDFVSFTELIAAHAAANPAGIAFTEGDASLTWHALSGRVRRVACALGEAGIRAGDKVAILAHPSLDYVQCLFGAIAARACVVPLAVSASVEALEAMLADSGAKMLFADTGLERPLQGLAARFTP